MSDVWYYAIGEKVVGPISLEKMEEILFIVSDPYNLPVWKSGLADWTGAGVVKELSALISTPPPLPKKRISISQPKTSEPQQIISAVVKTQPTGKIVKYNEEKRRWSLVRAAMWGLLLTGIVFGVKLLGIAVGTQSPDPWLNMRDVYPIELAAHWIGYFIVAPILFVVVALIRNLFVRN